VARYNAIYGSFAALPLFLMWIQISWWIVLFGAELSFASQNVDTYEYEPDCLKISPAFKKLLTLQVAHLLIHNFKKGQRPLTDSQLSQRLEIPVRLLHLILYELITTGLFIETKTNEDKKFGYQPARDINGLTIKRILEAIEQHGVDTIPVARTDEFKILSESLEKFSEAIENSPANRLLKDI
jgi:membrane protein